MSRSYLPLMRILPAGDVDAATGSAEHAVRNIARDLQLLGFKLDYTQQQGFGVVVTQGKAVPYGSAVRFPDQVALSVGANGWPEIAKQPPGETPLRFDVRWDAIEKRWLGAPFAIDPTSGEPRYRSFESEIEREVCRALGFEVGR